MIGNGDSSGGSVTRDAVSAELDRLDSAIGRLYAEREMIAALSYDIEGDREHGAALAAQDIQVGRDLAQAERHRADLLAAVAAHPGELPGGGMLFGLGVGPVVLGLAAAFAALTAWLAYVWNAMDARRTARQDIRAGLVARGQAPASIMDEEPGMLAEVRSTIGTAGLWIAGILGGLYLLGRRQARR